MEDLSKLGIYKENKKPVKFIIENADWAIKFVGENIKGDGYWLVD